jgi:hypothetical protein
LNQGPREGGSQSVYGRLSNLSTIDIDQVVVQLLGTVLCTVGYVAASTCPQPKSQQHKKSLDIASWRGV